MAQTSCDFGEFLRRSLCAAASLVAVGDDGLNRIWMRLAWARSSAAAADHEIAVRRARSARADRPNAGRGHGGHLTAHKIRTVGALDSPTQTLRRSSRRAMPKKV
jgi:hypothetical protein